MIFLCLSNKCISKSTEYSNIKVKKMTNDENHPKQLKHCEVTYKWVTRQWDYKFNKGANLIRLMF